MNFSLRYAARSDIGLVRKNNQDSGYAGPHLLVVADGMGGHAGGDIASSLAIREMAPLDSVPPGPHAQDLLRDSILDAHQRLLERVDEDPRLTGMGTTVTALLRTGDRITLAHIGDSRAYLLRNRELVQLTHDHTFVQTLVDDGRLTPAEAEHHPQRSVLMRVLSDVIDDVEPDLFELDPRLGDRYLLCSDGLSGVVSADTLLETLSVGQDPGPTCDTLIALARRAGGPDNITCIVIDVMPPSLGTTTGPEVVGSASSQPLPPTRPRGTSAAERAADLTFGLDTVPDDDVAPTAETPVILRVPAPKKGRMLAIRLIGGAMALALVAAGAWTAYNQVQQRYYLADADGVVAVYQGVPQSLGPVKLSQEDRRSTTEVTDLTTADRRSVTGKKVTGSSPEVSRSLEAMASRAAACATQTGTTGTGTSPTTTTTTTAAPDPSTTKTSGTATSGTTVDATSTTASPTGTEPTSGGTADDADASASSEPTSTTSGEDTTDTDATTSSGDLVTGCPQTKQ